MDLTTSSADLRAPSIATARFNSRKSKLGSPAQIAHALNAPGIDVQSKRSTHTYLTAFVRPDAGNPKDRRGSTGLFTRRRADVRYISALTRDQGIVDDARWAEKEAGMDVEDAMMYWACEESASCGAEEEVEMEGLRDERREGGYGSLVERAVSSNRERLRKRLEGDGWEFVGGRYGEVLEMEVEIDGSEGSVDEEFDGVVVCAVELS